MKYPRKLLSLLMVGFMYLVPLNFIYPQAKGTDETIRIETRLVSVPVIVSDRNGRYIAGLRAEDFVLLQDGLPQKIEYFGASEEPLVIALLIDCSESARAVFNEIKDAAKAFVRLLKPADRAMVVAFDREIRVLSPLTSDRHLVSSAIDSAKVEPLGTALRDALIDTISNSLKGIRGRKAIILLTDGKDLSSRTSPAQLFYEVQESDTLIYPVMFKTDYTGIITEVVSTSDGPVVTRYPANFPAVPLPGTTPKPETFNDKQNRQAAEFLQTLSSQTAGRLFHAKEGTLRTSFAAILNELRYQYRLEFYPSEKEESPINEHEISVKVKVDGSVVRVRKSHRPRTLRK